MQAAEQAGGSGTGTMAADPEALQKKIAQVIAKELQVRLWQVEAAVSLIDEGNTIPFIARYRKEATGTLDDEQLRNLDERLTYLRNLEEKKEKVLETIEAQGRLTAELRAQIEGAQTQVEVEDIYRPFRPKRRTRAGIAKEKGLQGLADWLLSPGADHPALEEAAKYVSAEKEVATAEEALQGARDILAEMLSDNAQYRTRIREYTLKDGFVVSAKKEVSAKKAAAKAAGAEEKTKTGTAGRTKSAAGKKKGAGEDRSEVYEMYFAYEEQAAKIPGHRILALNRGESEGFLTVKVDAPREQILRYLERQVIRRKRGDVNPYTAPILEAVCADSYDRLIGPAIERETRNMLTEKAEDGAIAVFNLCM